MWTRIQNAAGMRNIIIILKIQQQNQKKKTNKTKTKKKKIKGKWRLICTYYSISSNTYIKIID